MMKEDYLWNKTGSDAEIEKLENALKAFRFEAQEPPALPTKVTSSDEKRPFSFFKLGFAFAFAASVCCGRVFRRLVQDPRKQPHRS
jgi:hypothetical protein